MGKVGALRIVRFPNLLMVGATMYLMRWSLIKPLLANYGLELQVSEVAFLGLVLSTILITAAGYVINDYHDVKADQINKPGKMVVGYTLSRRHTMLLHWVLNFFGVSAGIVFSLLYKVPWLIIVFVGAPMLLWYYSVRLKHMLLAGNLAVSILTATVPLLVVLFEYPILSRHYQADQGFYPEGLYIILAWVSVYAFFAFMLNLIREIVKDAEDVEGDLEMGSRTIPIIYGIPATRRIIIALSLITILVLGFFFLYRLNSLSSLVYFAIALLFPFVLLMVRTAGASKAEHFRRISLLVKMIMLAGLLYPPVMHWLIRSIGGS